jgi:hypothetical protein
LFLAHGSETNAYISRVRITAAEALFPVRWHAGVQENGAKGREDAEVFEIETKPGDSHDQET